MGLTPDFLLAVSVVYVGVLFLIAWYVDRRAGAGKLSWLRSGPVYTLSISVYCTSWTFYGAVGSAARSGLEFATIYLGPTLVFVGWYWLMRKLVRLGREQRLTSVADAVSSRYGKSQTLAVMVTVIAVIGTMPYIALQLQSVALSVATLAPGSDQVRTAFWVATGMGAFTILFGTRTVAADERHHGVVAAIAVEAVVKLAALVAVGLFVTFGVLGGFGAAFDAAPPDLIDPETVFGARWAAITFLSASAMFCLPRMFQVTVVENLEEDHLRTASWLFPLYLFLMSLFVLPIAIAGLDLLPEGTNPDMFMLTVPLAVGREDLALLAFIGGFSSATSMVIVAAIALSTMVSNQIVMPLALRSLNAVGATAGDVRELMLLARRISIAAIFALGFLYFRLSGGSDALAAIGLIAFAGLAQVLPSLIAGLYWRSATRAGAVAGLAAGGLVWAYTLFLPSVGPEVLMDARLLAEGPYGLEWLRPHSLFGSGEGGDPLVHALVWSLGLNVAALVLVSQVTLPGALERAQASLFVDVFRPAVGELPGEAGGEVRGRGERTRAAPEELFVLAQRILGAERASTLFREMARAQGLQRGLPRPTEDMIARLERTLAGSIGAASAHAMVSRATGGARVSLSDLIDIADETQRLIATSARLADKTAELERTAVELREANTRLRALDARKDEFLSQVSHELRTPMTSIRSFSEILLDADLDPEQTRRFVGIIHDESLRLTRLLDEILDLNRLESGASDMTIEDVDAERAVSSAIDTLRPMAASAGVILRPHRPLTGEVLRANPDRLRQVLINLISNAIKYNAAPEPHVQVRWRVEGDFLDIDVVDNGGGVDREEADRIFSKFVRGQRSGRSQGAGLGLPISRAVVRRMGGELSVVFEPDQSSFFRVRLPRAGTGIDGGGDGRIETGDSAAIDARPGSTATSDAMSKAPSGSG